MKEPASEPWVSDHLPDILWDNRELISIAYRGESLAGSRAETREILHEIDVLDSEFRMLPAFPKTFARMIADGLPGRSLGDLMYEVAVHHAEWFRSGSAQ